MRKYYAKFLSRRKFLRVRECNYPEKLSIVVDNGLETGILIAAGASG
jgi:hypothetical protein